MYIYKYTHKLPSATQYIMIQNWEFYQVIVYNIKGMELLSVLL
jgi:hypothetical protein